MIIFNLFGCSSLFSLADGIFYPHIKQFPVLQHAGMKILWLINKVSGAVFAHRFVIFIKGIEHNWMVIRTREGSFVNYYWFHTLQVYTFSHTKYNTLYRA